MREVRAIFSREAAKKREKQAFSRGYAKK